MNLEYLRSGNYSRTIGETSVNVILRSIIDYQNTTLEISPGPKTKTLLQDIREFIISLCSNWLADREISSQ